MITRIADELNAKDRVQLLSDLENARATEVTGDGSRIEFAILGYQRPPYRGQHSYPASGRMLDRDGEELSVTLYADENGRLLELEIVRWADNDLQGPNWNSFEIQYK